MMPSANDLTYFLEVANTQNVSRAAERLGVTQPALSLAIRRLEDSFGAPLLIRGKSGVQLTRGGQRLVAQARNLLSEWEKIRSEALRDESQVSGRFTLGCHVSVALYTLPYFLPALLQKHPSLEVQMVHDLSRKITEEVISFKVDFGIVVNPTPHPDLCIKLLAKDEVQMWTSSKLDCPTQDAHSGEGVLICEPNLLQTQSIVKQMQKKGISHRRMITSTSLEVIGSLVASGVGFGILPSRVARQLDMGLKPIKDSPKYQDEVCLVYRADAHRSKASKTIVKAILEQALAD